MLEQDYNFYEEENHDNYYPEDYHRIVHRRSHYFEYDYVEGEIYNDDYGYED